MNRQNSHFLAHLLCLQRSLVVKLGVSPSRSRSLTRSHSLSSGDSTISHKGCSAETKSRLITTNNLQKNPKCISCTEVRAVYTEVVAEQPHTGVNAVKGSLAPFPTDDGTCHEGGTCGHPAELSPPSLSPLDKRRTKQWAPLLTNVWTLIPPFQRTQMSCSIPQPRILALCQYIFIQTVSHRPKSHLASDDYPSQ
jgi:hypothetical protein